MLSRLAEKTSRSLRVKTAFCAKGARQRFLQEQAAAAFRRQVRSQSLVNLRLAGQFFNDTPITDRTANTPQPTKPHLMRAMLLANIDVPHGFANGTTGRIAYWSPETTGHGRKPISATHPDLLVRFYKGISLEKSKNTYIPSQDFIDLTPRAETVLRARGQPTMFQLQI